MFTLIQIIISIVVVYLIFSTVVNVIVEGISGLLQLRGKMLQRAVLHLFNDSGLGEMLYNHPRIKTLKAPDNKLPSYIPSSSISKALIDIFASGSKPDSYAISTYDKFVDGVKNEPSAFVRKLFGTFIDEAKDIESLSAAIEKWFDDSMDRVSGWYKRKTKTIILIVAVMVTVGCNVDTIHVIRSAQTDPILRQHLNDLGDKLMVDSSFLKAGAIQLRDEEYYEDYVNDSSVHAPVDMDTQLGDRPSTAQIDSTLYENRMKQLAELDNLIRQSDLPIGWTQKKKIDLFALLGWLLTVFALSAGAPFWFDVLKKVVNIRSTGPKPASSK